MKNEYIFDVPRSEGVKNAIARAKQQCEIAWEPKRECIANDDGKWGYLVPARSGRAHVMPKTYSGIPYSSTRVLDKLVGLDISFSTFLSASENPISILYTRDLSDREDAAFHPRISNAYFTYGTVCSSLASYAMDLPMHYSTREWEGIPGFSCVAKESVDEIALGDTMVTFNKTVGHTGGHVAVITDIARDGEGRVQRVEITEGWEPTQRFRWDSRKAFEARMLKNGGDYLVFRNENIDSVRPPLGVERAPTDLMLDLGAFSAYSEEEAVCFHIAAPADALVIESEGSSLRIDASELRSTEIDAEVYTVYETKLPPAFYRAYLEKEGKRSEAVCFSVVRAPRPEVMKADDSALCLAPFIPVATDGAPLDEKSPCLYKKDSDVLLRTAPFALFYNGKLYSAYGALKEEDGKLMLYPSVPMWDGEGNAVRSFAVGDSSPLYLPVCEEGEMLALEFSGAVATEPYSLCPKEEAAVTFDQRLITDAERAEKRLLWKAIPSPYNRFACLSIIYKNAYGKVTSAPYSLIIL